MRPRTLVRMGITAERPSMPISAVVATTSTARAAGPAIGTRQGRLPCQRWPGQSTGSTGFGKAMSLTAPGLVFRPRLIRRAGLRTGRKTSDRGCMNFRAAGDRCMIVACPLGMSGPATVQGSSSLGG